MPGLTTQLSWHLSGGTVEVTMRLISAIVLILLASTVTYAGDARFGQVVLGVEGDSTARTVFAPDTPVIVLRAEIIDILVGTRLTATWVAVSAEGAAAN